MKKASVQLGTRRAPQRGLTLVELMLALAIGLVITLAAVTALLVARKGFSSVDAASQLRDNGRFAVDMVRRIAQQTGFKDASFVAMAPSQKDLADDLAGLIPANITGFNNAVFDSADLTTAAARSATVTGYGSDVLILRYQTSTLDGYKTADGSMIDCAGNTVTSAPLSRNDRLVSAFYVGLDDSGEPSLMCWSSTPGLSPNPQALVRGVENFQVLYGIDGFTSVNNAFNKVSADSVPEKYLRADQLVVGGNPASQATYNNWRLVRSLRIGIVLRGATGTQLGSPIPTIYPFGMAPNSDSGAPGSALSSDADIGTIFSVPSDGRQREVVTFTVHLRNDQSL
jgi:type IV pilus assembly protein PilW